MFCGNCGRKLEEGELFCCECGTKVPEEIVEEAPEIKEEIIEETVNDIETAEEMKEEEPSEIEEIPEAEENAEPEETVTPLETEPEVTPSKKFGLLAKIGAVLVLAVIVVAIVLSPGVKNGFMKTILSSDKYFQHVLKSNAQDYTDILVGTISDYKDLYEDDFKIDGTIDAEIGEGLDGLVRVLGGEGIPDEASWAKNAALDFEAVMDEDKAGANLKLKLNGKDITSGNFSVDLEKGIGYAMLPDINKQGIFAKSPRWEGVSEPDYVVVNEIMDEVLDAIPSESESKKIIARYVKCIANEIKDVNEDTEKVELNGISQKLTKLTVKINEEMLLDAAKAVLLDAKKDKDIKKIISEFEDIEELSVGNLYKEYQDAVSLALDELEDVDPSDETLCKISIWVNGKGEIIGFKAGVDEGSVTYTFVEKGNKYAEEYKVESGFVSVIIDGKGKASAGKRSGEHKIKVNGMDIANITLKGLDTDKLEKGVFCGTVTISPSDGAKNLLSMSAGESIASAVSDMKLVIKSESASIKKSDCNISLYRGDELCGAIGFKGNVKGGGKVSIPKKCADADDYDAMQKWQENMSFDKVISNLEKAGVPKDLIDMAVENIY